MTLFLLIRHGATDEMTQKLCGRLPGIHLNSRGRAQADLASRWLRKYKLDAVWSSPLERACETAQFVAAPHNIDPKLVDGFNELDFGDWSGKSFQELNSFPLWHQYNRSRSLAVPPGGEEPLAARSRAFAALFQIANDNPGSSNAVITHADIVRSLLTGLLDTPLDNLLRIEIAPASLTEISIGGEYPVIHSVNRTFEEQF